MAATLTALAYDNTPVLTAGVLAYNVILPFGSSTPVVTATAEDGASAVIVQPTSARGSATVTVTEGEDENIYTINFYSHEVGLVGWRQTTNSSLTIDSANLTSRSGRYFQGASGIVTPENIIAAQPDKDMSTDQLNSYLAQMVYESYQDVIKAVFDQGKIVENALLYEHPDNWQTFNENATDFVGFEFDPPMISEMSVRINAVFAEFETSGTHTLYLFHTSKKDPVGSIAITLGAKTAVRNLTTWVLKRMNNQVGGKYLIGYFTSGLISRSLYRGYQLSNVMNRFLTTCIRPIKVTGWNTVELPDLALIEYTANSVGLNFDISGVYDYTSFVDRNELSFSKALQLAVGCRVLNEIATSSRINEDVRKIRPEALFELNGNRSNPEIPYSAGMLSMYDKEIKTLRSSFRESTTKGTLS